MTSPQNEIDRPRRWQAVQMSQDEQVILQNFALLQPGEVLESDDPEQREVPWDKWLLEHETIYSCALDGRPTAEYSELKAAVQRIKTKAQNDGDWAALWRLLRELGANRLAE